MEITIYIDKEDDGTYQARLATDLTSWAEGDTPQEAVGHLMELCDDEDWWPEKEDDKPALLNA